MAIKTNIELKSEEFTPNVETSTLVSIGNIALSDWQTNHDKKSPEENEEIPNIQEIFNRNRLLARAMDEPGIAREDGGFRLDFRTWDEEVDFMEGDGLNFASCTLLVPEKAVPTYKHMGLLMDGDDSKIIHVAKTDSRSSGGDISSKDGLGDFWAGTSDLDTLDQLASAIRSTENQSSIEMNEVNAHFEISSLKGLFTLDAKSINNRLELLAVHRHLVERGVILPMYVYKIETGEMTEWKPTQEEVREILRTCTKSKLVKVLFAKYLDIELE